MQLIKSCSLRFLCVASLSFFSFVANALSPADFAKDYQYHDVQISPDGKHIALVIKDKGKRKLAVVKASDFSSVGGADFGKKQEVGNFFWANDERLVININHFWPWYDRPYPTGELFAIDYTGKRGEIIYGYRAGDPTLGSKLRRKESILGYGLVINRLAHDDNDVLIASYPASRDGSRVPTVHKLNIDNGNMSGIMAGGPAPFADFVTDKNGNVRMAIGRERDFEKSAFYYIEDKNDWQEIPSEQFGRGYYPLTIDASGENLYFVDTKGHNTEGLYRKNLKTGDEELLFRDDKNDISSIVYSYDETEIYAVRTDPGYPQYTVFDKRSKEAQVYDFLVNSFKGFRVSITSSSEDGNLWALYVSNDKTAGSFYLYDAKQNQFRLLFSNFASLPQASLSESIPFSFKASDGMEIPGYITYPASVDPSKNVPLVTLVHGGPASRDYWTFDREVQMLAAQGYAVLRLNFRGSTGYGLAHQDGSEKQWGTRVQQDIIEGTKWVIQQGGIDQNKVCIMGTSFGAFSSVMSASIEPDLFKCVVANAGVYDLEMMFDEGDIPKILFGKAFLEIELGNDKELMRQQSPVNHVQKIKGSVLVAHGNQDERAPFKHAEKLMERMQSHGIKYETFIKDTAGHGFFDETYRTEYFEKVAEFLAKHLK